MLTNFIYEASRMTRNELPQADLQVMKNVAGDVIVRVNRREVHSETPNDICNRARNIYYRARRSHVSRAAAIF
ncbi:MAG: hypothetical protein LC734_00655 [Acidobacteria bacterium]|nr:hypothetical protein [Acidobacteriota bacterium]